MSEILSFLQTNKFTNHSFIDAGRRHKIPGQRQRTLLQHSRQPLLAPNHSASAVLSRTWCLLLPSQPRPHSDVFLLAVSI